MKHRKGGFYDDPENNRRLPQWLQVLFSTAALIGLIAWIIKWLISSID